MEALLLRVVQPARVAALLHGLVYCAGVALLSHLLSLPLPTAFAVLLPLPLLAPVLYRLSAFAQSPHGRHFRGLLIAHRGGRVRRPRGGPASVSAARAPENSLAAFRLTAQYADVDAVELDVWLSADGQPVVLHDGYIHRVLDGRTDDAPTAHSTAAVRRTTHGCVAADRPVLCCPLPLPLPFPCSLSPLSGAGHVRLLSVAQLRALRYRPVVEAAVAELSDDDCADAVEAPTAVGEAAHVAATEDSEHAGLPTLEEVVALVLPTHLRLMIEVKELHRPVRMASALHALFRRHPELYTRAFVASFLPWTLLAVRWTDPHIATAAIGHPHLSALLLQHARLLRLCAPAGLQHSWLLRAALDAMGRAALHRAVLRFLGCSLAVPHVSSVSAGMVQDYRAAGLDVCVWTVNRDDERAWLERLGCGLVTDFLPFARTASP